MLVTFISRLGDVHDVMGWGGCACDVAVGEKRFVRCVGSADDQGQEEASI